MLQTLLVLVLLLPAAVRAEGKRLNVVCTIGMIADVAKEVAGPHADVEGLMQAGVDPHLYKATASDLQKLTGADVVFYNGLNLEGKMADVLVKMARKRRVVAVSEDIDRALLREPAEMEGHYDPHIWFDVSLWSLATEKIAAELAEADPASAEAYRKNAAAYRAKLGELHGWVKAQIATIPKERRVLVTAHDAFGYFGRAYDIEVRGLQGISTAAEYGLHDVNGLVDLITARGIRAIFVESSVSPRSIEAVQAGVKAKGGAVAIGGTLFSDAMGTAGTPEGTYIGMVRANVNTIVGALK